jgi:hypothetical protein
METRLAIPPPEVSDAFQLLADRVFASKEIERQIGADSRKRFGIGEPGSRGKRDANEAG